MRDCPIPPTPQGMNTEALSFTVGETPLPAPVQRGWGSRRQPSSKAVKPKCKHLL